MEEKKLKELKCFKDALVNAERLLQSGSAPIGNKISPITENLYLSGIGIATNLDELEGNNIQAVVTLGEENLSEKLRRAYSQAGILHLYLEIEDDPRRDIISACKIAYPFIYGSIAENKKVLVHCAAGVSRSVSVVAYFYLRRYYIINFQDDNQENYRLTSFKRYHLIRILRMLKEIRPCIRPNPGFLKQLLAEEYKIKLEYRQRITVEKRKREEPKATSGNLLPEYDTLQDIIDISPAKS